MEAAGLALGVVTILSTFKDVAELYALFVDSRRVGRDYEMLDTKLEVERTMLLHWADRVGLLRSDYDPRLDVPNTQETVFRVLACIRTLLSDTAQLKTRYGLQALEAPDSDTPISIESVASEDTKKTISGAPMERLTRELDKLRLRQQPPQQPKLVKRFSWAVRDKQQFGNLASDLSHFTTKLNDLLPANSGPSVAQSEPPPYQGFPGHSRGPGTLNGESGIEKRGIPNTAQDVVDEKYQDKILETLWFRTMEAREEEIKFAHSKTLNWVFEAPDGTVEWDDLSEWLRSGKDIYWVSGKAGSGKSTLMKRLFHHERTKELLSEWAKGGPVHLISFFFWNLGTPEQKTQEGLARSLLHQILSRHPSLIREALPGMWKELNRTNDTVSLPSLAEARRAFQVVAAKAGELGKFCFLIDGLDEFTGDYRNAIDFIEDLTANPGFKAVVSSRPIPECVDAFEDNPGLRLNQLTYPDISTYVNDVIGGHKYMKKLMNRHPAKARQLMGAITAKSSGVFLWVVLACRSVLAGFADYDRIDELWRRVDELPPELEDMFKLMLSKINKRHREQGAFTLRVCHSLTVGIGSSTPFHALGDMSAVPLALLCQEDADPEVLSVGEKEALRDDLQGWLTSRCGGLLETHQKPHPKDPLTGTYVEWTHRSVVEFLNGDGTWELECLHIDEDRPGIPASLSLYYLHTIMQEDQRSRIRYNVLFAGMLDCGAFADAEAPERKDHSFWRIDPYLVEMRRIDPIFADACDFSVLKTWLDRHLDASQAASHAALLLAAESGAVNYMQAHPDFTWLCQWEESPCGCLPLLYHAAAHPFTAGMMITNRPGPPSALRTTIALLLSLGADPNMTVEFRGSDNGHGGWSIYLDTPWRGWLNWVVLDPTPPQDVADIADITAMFLAAGADPTPSVRSWILSYLSDPRNRNTLTVSDAQLSRAVDVLRGQLSQTADEGKQEDGRPWLTSAVGFIHPF
ncbi:prion-inhibition and propagation-domain-containing protein [Chaetomium fimeti]|uniref:Prion-inhibition and propagation-domain-containing protein n=1 Tax=Chaetomium fimeti TaxID=1854472 RepID=A0AAE0HIA1_9PEZI|nr:prion-inhibition and propagation-domain-containing protein [Chaetomium fimeti]